MLDLCCFPERMPFPDPFDDPDEPAWKRKAEAVEYLALSVVVGGAFLASLWGAARWAFS